MAVTLRADHIDSLGHGFIYIRDKIHGTISEQSFGHYSATVTYWHRKYTVTGYSTAAAAVTAVEALINRRWHWRR